MKKQEVKESKVVVTKDPLEPHHRNLLRAGQVVTDYEEGHPHSRHMFVSADAQYLMMKATVKV